MHRLLDIVKDSPRDSAIVHVLAFCGLRVSELSHLLVEDIEFERHILHVRSGKGTRTARSFWKTAPARRSTAILPNGRSRENRRPVSSPSGR